MVAVPGGDFLMGSEDFYPEERPVRAVDVEGFWMDEQPVTVAEFRRFVRETGYVTVAERPLDPADYPDADPDAARPGLARLPADAGPVPLDDFRSWWAYVPGACWKRPGGPGNRRSTAATAIRSSRSPTRTPWPTPPGPARSCRPRPSGSTRRAAAWRAPPSPGATSTSRAGARWPTPGRASFPWQNLKLDGFEGTSPGGQLPAERLRPLRHGRQRLGVDDGLLRRPTATLTSRRAARRRSRRRSASRAA